MIFVWIVIGLVALFGVTVFFGAPYVPSRTADVRRAFETLHPLTSADMLLDIGSGDGVVLRIAASYGARAVGYEINPVLVVISKWLARGNPRVVTQLKNFWVSDFPADTTIVYVFGESRDIKRMAKRVQQQVDTIGRPVHVLSYGFMIPGKTPVASSSSHHLYSFTASHDKALTV